MKPPLPSLHGVPFPPLAPATPRLGARTRVLVHGISPALDGPSRSRLGPTSGYNALTPNAPQLTDERLRAVAGLPQSGRWRDFPVARCVDTDATEPEGTAATSPAAPAGPGFATMTMAAATLTAGGDLPSAASTWVKNALKALAARLSQRELTLLNSDSLVTWLLSRYDECEVVATATDISIETARAAELARFSSDDPDDRQFVANIFMMLSGTMTMPVRANTVVALAEPVMRPSTDAVPSSETRVLIRRAERRGFVLARDVARTLLESAPSRQALLDILIGGTEAEIGALHPDLHTQLAQRSGKSRAVRRPTVTLLATRSASAEFAWKNATAAVRAEQFAPIMRWCRAHVLPALLGPLATDIDDTAADTHTVFGELAGRLLALREIETALVSLLDDDFKPEAAMVITQLTQQLLARSQALPGLPGPVRYEYEQIIKKALLFIAIDEPKKALLNLASQAHAYTTALRRSDTPLALQLFLAIMLATESPITEREFLSTLQQLDASIFHEAVDIRRALLGNETKRVAAYRAKYAIGQMAAGAEPIPAELRLRGARIQKLIALMS